MPMIEEALKELDQIISELSKESSLLKENLLQKKIFDNAIIAKQFAKIEELCSKIKFIKMTIMLQVDHIKDQQGLQ